MFTVIKLVTNVRVKVVVLNFIIKTVAFMAIGFYVITNVIIKR
jgi:hypothetical protein